MMTRDPVSNRTRQPFIVSSNGSVITNMFFQPNMHGSFVLPILVTDGVHSSDTANLTVSKALINSFQVYLDFNVPTLPWKFHWIFNVWELSRCILKIHLFFLIGSTEEITITLKNILSLKNAALGCTGFWLICLFLRLINLLQILD